MAEKSLQIRAPQTIAEQAEGWAGLPRDVRKRRAAKASQEGDREELRSLLRAWIMLYGRRGTDTSENTINTYWRGADLLISWCESAGVKVHQLTGDHARRFMAWLSGRAPATRATYKAGAKALLNALRWTGLSVADAFAGVRVVDPISPAEKADPYASEELTAMLKNALPRERALILLGADAGLRVGEIALLTWEDVHLRAKEIRVRGKGGRVATVAITERLKATLQALPYPHRGPVFDVSRRRLQQMISQAAKRAGVRPRGLHALRHSCGTRLYALTRDLLAVRRHLRHSSARTSEIYAHLADTDYRAAVDRLDGNGVAQADLIPNRGIHQGC